MTRDSGDDSKLSAILDRLLDPIDELVASLANEEAVPDDRPASAPATRATKRGENVSATMAIPKSLAKRGGQSFVGFSILALCAECGGAGSARDATGACPACSGRGRVEVERRLNVTFPAGVATGAELRVRGEGSESPDGGPPGDLVLYVMVMPKGRITGKLLPRRLPESQQGG